MDDFASDRRDLLLAGLAAALPLGLADAALASPIDPQQTIIRKPDELKWTSDSKNPPRSVEMCPLVGATTKEGLYYTLVRWWPGYMSSPHSYATDRNCMVLSGTWWCNSGADFDPAACVPVPAGSFVRRVARTPHYDGVIKGHKEPVIIAICGIGPVKYERSNPKDPFVMTL